MIFPRRHRHILYRTSLPPLVHYVTTLSLYLTSPPCLLSDVTTTSCTLRHNHVPVADVTAMSFIGRHYHVLHTTSQSYPCSRRHRHVSYTTSTLPSCARRHHCATTRYHRHVLCKTSPSRRLPDVTAVFYTRRRCHASLSRVWMRSLCVK